MCKKNDELNGYLDYALEPILSSMGNSLMRLEDWSESGINIWIERCVNAFDGLVLSLDKATMAENYSSVNVPIMIEFLGAFRKDPNLRLKDKKSLDEENHKELNMLTKISMSRLHRFGKELHEHYGKTDMGLINEEISWSIICIKMLRVALRNNCFARLGIDGSVIYGQQISEGSDDYSTKILEKHKTLFSKYLYRKEFQK